MRPRGIPAENVSLGGAGSYSGLARFNEAAGNTRGKQMRLEKDADFYLKLQ